MSLMSSIRSLFETPVTDPPIHSGSCKCAVCGRVFWIDGVTRFEAVDCDSGLDQAQCVKALNDVQVMANKMGQE